MELKKLSEIAASAQVKNVLKKLIGLSKPSSALRKCLDALNNIEKSEFTLEELLGIFIAWQNYYAEQLVLVETIKTIAEAQANHFWGEAINNSNGTINAKKELAKSDMDYVGANTIFINAKNAFKAIESGFWNCDRAYKLISRIVAIKTNIANF